MNSRISYITFNLPLLIDYAATFACRGISRDSVLKLVLEHWFPSMSPNHSLGFAWAYIGPISYWVHFYVILKEMFFYFHKLMLHNPNSRHSPIFSILIPWLIEYMYLKMIFFMRFFFLDIFFVKCNPFPKKWHLKFFFYKLFHQESKICYGHRTIILREIEWMSVWCPWIVCGFLGMPGHNYL